MSTKAGPEPAWGCAAAANPRRGRTLRLLRSVQQRGLRRTGQRLLEELRDGARLAVTGKTAYERWFYAQLPRLDQAQALRAEVATWSERPKISVLMPVCDPDTRWLRAAIASVRHQIYPEWELVAVDDASRGAATWDALREAASSDARIRVARGKRRSGISGASNAALDLASGSWVALLDHDDELTPDALLEVARSVRQGRWDALYSDEDKITAAGRLRDPVFKPDLSPDYLRSCNYFGHLCCYRSSLIRDLGGFRTEFDGSQDHDLALRTIEATSRVGHLPKVLYHWRITPGSAANPAGGAKPWAYDAGRRAIAAHLERTGADAQVRLGFAPGFSRVDRPAPEKILVTLLREEPGRERSGAPIGAAVGVERIALASADSGGTVAKRWNRAAASAHGDILVFLASGLQGLGERWIDELASQAWRPEVGAVGARILSPRGHLLHMGVVLGGPEHVRWGAPGIRHGEPGELGVALTERNVSAVSGGCIAIRRKLFDELSGFDESYSVGLHDVDLCLQLRERGYWVVYQPYAEVCDKERNRCQYSSDDLAYLRQRWGHVLDAGDPFSNPGFDLRGPPYRPRYRTRRSQ